MIILECQGQVMEMTDLTYKGKRPPVTHRRGVVRGFSAGSRRRMINFVSRFDLTGQRCVFMTLTFNGIPSAKDAKRALKMFSMRLRRAHAGMSGIWRVEMQERGSPHFHLILFNMPYVPQADLRASWMECTGEEKSGLRLTLMRNPEMVMRYVSKYVAKVDPKRSTLFSKASYQHKGENNGTGAEFEGRAWGWIGFDFLPLAALTFAQVLDADTVHLFHWSVWAKAGRRWKNAGMRATGYSDAAKSYAQTVCASQSGVLLLEVARFRGTLAVRKDLYSKLRQWVDSRD